MGDIMWAKMTLNARYGWTYGDNGHQQNLGTNSSRRQRPRVGILGKDVGDIRHGTCPGASMLSRARGEVSRVTRREGNCWPKRVMTGEGGEKVIREGKDERGTIYEGQRPDYNEGPQTETGPDALITFLLFVYFFPAFFSPRCLDYVIQYTRAWPGLTERHGVCLCMNA